MNFFGESCKYVRKGRVDRVEIVAELEQINNSLNGGQGVVSRSSVASSSAFLGCKQKASSSSSGSLLGTTVAVNGNNKSRVVCEAAKSGSGEDRWKGLGYDISDDQQDIQRGKGMVDSLFQGATGVGTQTAIMSSYDYISTAQRT